MKIITRISLFLKRIIEKLMPINKCEQLNSLFIKYKKILYDAKQNYYNSLGKEEYYQKELDNNKVNSEKLLSIAKKYKEKNDTTKLKETYNMYDLSLKKIENYQKFLDEQKEITLKLNTFISQLERKVSKLECEIEILKTKNEFNNNIKNIKRVCNVDSGVDLDIVTKGIEIDYNANMIETDSMSLDNIEDIKYGDEFDKFVDDLG